MPRKAKLAAGRDDKFSKLTDLNCFDEVRQKILNGWTVSDLVKYIQKDQLEANDMSEQALSITLYKYRRSIPPVDFVQTVAATDSLPRKLVPIHNSVVEQLKSGLDELAEMERLYAIQLDRVHRESDLEKKNGKLFPSMTQEVRVAKEILESSASLKMDLGLTPRHLGKMEAETRLVHDVAQRYGNEAVARVLSDPESRHRLASVAQRFMLSAQGAEVLQELLEQSEGMIIDTEPLPPVDPGVAS